MENKKYERIDLDPNDHKKMDDGIKSAKGGLAVAAIGAFLCLNQGNIKHLLKPGAKVVGSIVTKVLR